MNRGFQPKKRLFIALVSLAALVAAGAAYGLWEIMVPGLSQIHPWLPHVVGWAAFLLSLALVTGVVGIVLAILGFPTMRFFYFWAWHVINLLYPIAVSLGKLMGVSKRRVEQSFIEVSNHLVRRQHIRVPADRLLILTPHCIQLDPGYPQLPPVRPVWGGTAVGHFTKIQRPCGHCHRWYPGPAGCEEGPAQSHPGSGL